MTPTNDNSTVVTDAEHSSSPNTTYPGWDHSPTSDGSSYPGLAETFSLLADHPLFRASMLLYTISLPLLVVMGCVGNVLILVLQPRLHTKGSSLSEGSPLSLLLASLALSDSAMLLVSGPAWFLMFAFQISLGDFHDAACKLIFFVVYVTGLTSSWFLVVLTGQRAASIVWPHRAGDLWTVRAARWTVFGIVLTAVLLNSHVLYGRALQPIPTPAGEEHLCLYVSDDYRAFFENVWPLVDMLLSSFLPFLLILVSNVVLVRAVRQSAREARDMLTSGQADRWHARDKQTSSMTVTLVCVSCAFLLLTSPLTIFFVLQRTGGHVAIAGDLDDAARSFLLEAIGNVLWLSNNAVNFYIYLATGSRYRTALGGLFPCCRAAESG